MVAHWTPVLEDLDSSRFSPGTPSLHSEMMSPSAPYGPSYGPVYIARSHTASEDVPTTSHPTSSRTNPDAAIAKWFGQLAGDTGFQHKSPSSDIDWVRRRRSNSPTQQPETIDSSQNYAWEGRQYSPHIADVGAAIPGTSLGRLSDDQVLGLEPHPW
jgi:hypothetical protein